MGSGDIFLSARPYALEVMTGGLVRTDVGKV